MDILIKALQLILCLSLLVFVHELGHFMFAKMFKTRVEKFYLFFNPWFSLFKFKIGETEYGIGWIPFGGYVKISGMIDESMDKEQMKQAPKPYEFRSKPAWQRLLIMVGGVVMNIITACVIYICMSYHYGERYIDNKDIRDGYVFSEFAKKIGFADGDKIVSVHGKEFGNYLEMQQAIVIGGEGIVKVNRQGEEVDVVIKEEHIPMLLKKNNWGMTPRVPYVIDSVLDQSVAMSAGLLPGDSMLSVNGRSMRYLDEFKSVIAAHANDTITIAFARQGAGVMSTQTTQLVVPESGLLGVFAKGNFPDLYKISDKKYTLAQSIPQGFKRLKKELSSYMNQLRLMVNPQTEAYKQVGSVVAMGNFFPKEFNAYVFWNITALFSIMLAVLNILPIPALDGGHVVFLLYEVVTRRKPSDKFMEYAQMVGMFLLFALMLFAFSNDIIRLFS